MSDVRQQRQAPTATSRRAAAAVLLASMLFGTTGTALQRGPETATALGAGAARLLLGALTLVVIAATTRAGRRDWRRHWRAALVGGLMVALYQLSFFEATQRAGVAVATVCTIASGPVFAALIERARFAGRRGEYGRLGRSWWIGTTTCVAGVFLILSPDSSSTFAAAGVAAALVSGLGYAAYATAAKHQMEGGLDPAASMASLFGIGAALTAPLLLLEPVAWLRTGGGALMIVHLGVVTVGGAYTLYGRGLRLLPTPTVVTLTLAEPVTAAVLSVAVLGESLGITGWCGVAVVVTGLFVATRTGTVTAPAAERPATRRTTA